MQNRSLRGMSIGARSMERDEGIEPAPRLAAYYDCPNGHTIVLPFSTEADVPALPHRRNSRAPTGTCCWNDAP